MIRFNGTAELWQANFEFWGGHAQPADGSDACVAAVGRRGGDALRPTLPLLPASIARARQTRYRSPSLETTRPRSGQDVQRRTLAFAAAAIFGFVALAPLDAWHATPSWFDRLSVYLIGFSIARAAGALFGAPLKRAPRSGVVTRAGLLAALFVSVASFVWFGALLWAVAAPALDESASWSVDLLLALLVTAFAPLWLLAVRVERSPSR